MNYLIRLKDIDWDGAPEGTPTSHEFAVQAFPEDENEREHIVDNELDRKFGYCHHGYNFSIVEA